MNATTHAIEPKALNIAYIINILPGTTLTFFYMEVKKLRLKGINIDVYAIWKTNQQTISKEATSLCNETTYLSPPPIWQLCLTHCYYAWKRPARYLQMLKLCFAKHANIRLRRRTLYNFLLAPYLAASLEKRHISHIHAHFASGSATTAMMAAHVLNIGFSFTAHGSDILVIQTLLHEKLKRAKFAIAISEYNRERLLRESPVGEAHKVRIIHCGVDPDVFSPCTRTNNIPPVFLAVGSLVWQKGHVHLLEACRILRTSGMEYRCIIVGDGPKRHELENLLRQYKMEEQVELVGSVPHEDIHLYYNRADIIVHPSLSEGIPVVLMEAMSKELPVIATRITGIPELVIDEENGILVPPADSAELARAMTRLLESQEHRTWLGKNARLKILQDFNLDINIGEIKALFEREISL